MHMSLTLLMVEQKTQQREIKLKQMIPVGTYSPRLRRPMPYPLGHSKSQMSALKPDLEANLTLQDSNLQSLVPKTNASSIRPQGPLQKLGFGLIIPVRASSHSPATGNKFKVLLVGHTPSQD